MNGKHPEGSDAPKPPNIHRRIVSYGLLLVLAMFAFAILVNTRYQVSFSNNSMTIIRYDRWTGKVSSLAPGAVDWKAF